MAETSEAEEQPGGDRAKVIAAVVLLVAAIGVPLAVMALTSGGEDEPSRLRVETYPMSGTKVPLEGRLTRLPGR